ncbi:MFS general substrate transporter [Clavulina sp. PMI_390]|nr:MFS general substrate transporter [Clavulina sp. PMI_390]
MSGRDSTLEVSNNPPEQHPIGVADIGPSSSSLTTSSLTPKTSDEAQPPYSMFTKNQKWLIVILVTFCSVFSPLAASIYFPAIPSLTKAFHKDTQSINLTVTIYQISQGIAPSLWGALADVSGRRFAPIFIACMLLFTIIQFALAVIPTSAYAALLVLRLLSAAGSAPTIALGAGVVGDIAAPVERGRFMGLVFAGTMIGPCIGPVFGALLDARWGWRSIFWFLGIGSASAMIPLILFFPETLRALVGNGSIPARGMSRSLWSIIKAAKQKAQDQSTTATVVPDARKKSGNPFVALTYILEKDVAIILFFNAFQTAVFYAILTSLSSVMQKSYNLSTSTTGLTFLPVGISMFISNIITGRVLDREFRRMDPNDLLKFPVEHARLRLLPMYCVSSWIATIAYGWLLETKQPLAAPLIMQFIAGYGIMAVLQTSQVMLVDLYPSKSASMSANNNLIRCLTSAAGTAAIDPMTNALGIGWSLVIFTGFAALLSPLMVLEYHRGMKWRQERAERDRRREGAGQQAAGATGQNQKEPIDVERKDSNLEEKDDKKGE